MINSLKIKFQEVEKNQIKVEYFIKKLNHNEEKL